MTGYRKKRWEKISKQTTDLGRLIYAFEIRNKTLNRSPKTTAWYSNNLRLFIGFLRQRGHSLSIDDIGVKEIREFIIHLREKNRYDGHPITPVQSDKLSPRTVRAHVETLKAFLSWLHREDYIDGSVLNSLEFPKVPRKLKEVLSKDEVERLLLHLDRNTSIGCRNSTILMLFLDTGLRCAELVNIRLSDVHMDRGYIKVMGKGARERMVPIGSEVQKAIAEYVREFRPQPSNAYEGNLFLSDEGRPITVNGVQLMIKRLGRRCRIPRLHCHLLRHTFATNYLINGGDLFTLQSILGHSSLEMVRRYVSLASGFVAVQHRRFSPMDAMNLGIGKLNTKNVTDKNPMNVIEDVNPPDSNDMQSDKFLSWEKTVDYQFFQHLACSNILR